MDAVLQDVRKAVWLRFVPNALKYAVAAVVAGIGVVAGAVAGIEAVAEWALAWLGGSAAMFVAGAFHYRVGEGSWSVERQFEKYIKEPDYQSELGLLYLVDHDLDRALDLLCGEYPAAVFIDDLDRCDPETVTEIIFAINQFLSLPRRNVFFFLGMDMQMVASALERAPGSPKLSPASPYAGHQSFGWRFMEKFVQLPFVIPHLEPDKAKKFAERHLGLEEPFPAQTKIGGDALRQQASAAKDVDELAQIARDDKLDVLEDSERIEVQKTVSKRATELMAKPDSEEIARIAAIALDDLELNPRAIKRYFSLVRILRNLQITLGASAAGDYDRLLVLRAAHLLLNWPEAVQWIRRQEKVVTDDGKWTSAVQYVEEAVSATKDWGAWNKLWEQTGRQYTLLPKTFRNPRLFEYLCKITRSDPPSLSEIYNSGLI